MAHTRPILLTLAILLVGGSLAWTTGYSVHLRSESYRKEIEVDLSKFFELPSEVGRIRGRTFSSRSVHDVAIWLPGRLAVSKPRPISTPLNAWMPTTAAAMRESSRPSHVMQLPMPTGQLKT